MKKYLYLAFFAALVCSCNSNEEMRNTTAEEKKYTPEMVSNQNDYICGMPTSAGISDTCQIEGKSYGFCSAECMDEFKKDPAKYTAAK